MLLLIIYALKSKSIRDEFLWSTCKLHMCFYLYLSALSRYSFDRESINSSMSNGFIPNSSKQYTASLIL